MYRKSSFFAWIVAVLCLASGASAQYLNVPGGTTHIVTENEPYDDFDVAGTLIIESSGSLTSGDRSTLNGPGAQIIVNGGSLLINGRFNVGKGSDGYITMNGGTFTVTGTFKFPDNDGGVHRMYLNDGIMHSGDIEQKHDRDAIIYVGGGILRLVDITGGDRDPQEWKDNGDLLPAEGYDDILIEYIPAGPYTEVRAVRFDPNIAWRPRPSDYAQDVLLDANLFWSPGDCAVSHDVYFGTNFNAVRDASRLGGDVNGDRQVDFLDLLVLREQWLEDPEGLEPFADLNDDEIVNLFDFAMMAGWWQRGADAVFKGNQDSNRYDPCGLELNRTYYWRIDEVNGPNTWRGDAWCFKTREYPTFRAFSGVCRHIRQPLRPLYDKALGWGRQDICWDSLEPCAPGDPDYVWRWEELYDYGDLVLAYNAKNAHLLPILDYGTEWAGGMRMVDDEHVVDWQNYVERVVSFLSAPPYNVEYFQIWNEAHPCSGFWDGTMAEYMTNVHLPAAEVIHNLGCKVVYGGWPCCSYRSNLVSLLDTHSAWDSVDVLSMHYLGIEAWQYLRDAAAARGYEDMGIWATEVGFMPDLDYLLHYISNFYPRLFYWALTHNADVRPDMYKVFCYREWSADDPEDDGYHKTLYLGDNLWHLGTSLQTLGDLFDGGRVSDYQGVENDRLLTPQQGMDVSSVEAFEVDNDPNRIVVAIHLMAQDVGNPSTDTITLTYSEFMEASEVASIERVDVAGYETNLTPSFGLNGLEVTVPVADDLNSPVQGWGLDGSKYNFYVVVTRTE
jgi:hypothetical protein